MKAWLSLVLHFKNGPHMWSLAIGTHKATITININIYRSQGRRSKINVYLEFFHVLYMIKRKLKMGLDLHVVIIRLGKNCDQ